MNYIKSASLFNPDIIQVHICDNGSSELIGEYRLSDGEYHGTAIGGAMVILKNEKSMLEWMRRELEKKNKRKPKQEKSQTTLYELL